MLQTGLTALIATASNDHTATAAELVRLGADINARTNVRIARLQLCGADRTGLGCARRALGYD